MVNEERFLLYVLLRGMARVVLAGAESLVGALTSWLSSEENFWSMKNVLTQKWNSFECGTVEMNFGLFLRWSTSTFIFCVKEILTSPVRARGVSSLRTTLLSSQLVE